VCVCVYLRERKRERERERAQSFVVYSNEIKHSIIGLKEIRILN